METDRFDAVTARLAQGLTRRRGLGLLAALGGIAALAPDAEAGKKKGKKKRGKKKPKPQPAACGGACGPCQSCLSGVCTQVADKTACTGGTCFDGQCLVCSGGKVPVDGLCARLCETNADCGEANVYCHTYYAGNAPRYCMRGQDFATTPDCSSGDSSECGAGRLCVNYGLAPKCLLAA